MGVVNIMGAFRILSWSIGDTDFGHSSEFRGFKGFTFLGGCYYISSMWLSVGDQSLGHYSEVGCLSEEGLLIEVLPYTSSRDVDTSPLFTSLLECPSSEVTHTHTFQFNSQGSWGERANKDLKFTKG